MTVPPTGWYVEVDHPDGTTLTPTVVGEPSINPQVNSLPELTIPIDRDEKWIDETLKGQPMRVWQDGVRQPVDELERVTPTESGLQLEGRGGLELDQRIEREYDSKPIHQAVQEIITTETSYAANVDAPPSTVSDDVTVQSAETESELRDALLNPISDTQPIAIQNGGIELLQSNQLKEAENGTYTGLYTEASASKVSNGASVRLQNTGEFVRFSAQVPYRYPDGQVRAGVRLGNPSSVQDVNGFEVRLNGQTVESIATGARLANNWSWFQGDYTGALRPGSSHTLTVECTGTATDDVYVDVFCFYDDRFNYTFDNTVSSNGTLRGPELYPESRRVVFADAEVTQSVTAAELASTWTSTAGDQQLALSNDRGDSYRTLDNSDRFSVNFTALGPSVRFRATLSRYGTAGARTPSRGYRGQRLGAFEIDAQLDDTPLVVSQSYDAKIRDILTDMARKGDFAWEYRRSAATRSTTTTDGAVVGSATVGTATVGSSSGSASTVTKESVEWTRPGQRVADQDLDVLDYEISESVAEQYDKVIVYGQTVPVRGEVITADVGTFVGLSNSPIKRESETVRDPDTGDQFDRGLDYRLDYENGRLAATDDGDLVDGEQYEVSYQYQTRGSFTVGGAPSPPEETVEDITEISTTRGAQQAARIIAQEVSTPLREAEITIPTDVGFSVVDNIPLDSLPTTAADLHIRSVKNTPEATVLTLGARREVSEVISRIETRVSSISRTV